MCIVPRFKPNFSFKKIAKVLIKSFSNTLNPYENQKNRQLLEGKFAEYLGVKNAICVPSARMGLFLILKNLGLSRSSEVILPAFTYWAVPEIVKFLKYNPIFVDINSQSWDLDVSSIEARVTSKTKAIIPTHLYGLPCNMDEVVRIAKKYNLVIIGDCVQAYGSEYKGQKSAILGDAAYFSFGVTKNVFLLGGGLVVTDKNDLAAKIRNEVNEYDFLNKSQIFKRVFESLIMKTVTHPFIFPYGLFPIICLFNLGDLDIIDKVYDAKKKLDNKLPKEYYRLVPYYLQIEAGFEELKKIDLLNNKRIQHASYFIDNLKGVKGLTLPYFPQGNIKNIFTSFPLQTENRSFLKNKLLKKGIDVSYGYMKAHDVNCPNAVRLEKNILHLPVYPGLDKKEVKYICDSIKKILNNA